MDLYNGTTSTFTLKGGYVWATTERICEQQKITLSSKFLYISDEGGLMLEQHPKF